MDEKIHKILLKSLEHSSQAVLFFNIKERKPFLTNKQAIVHFANKKGEIDIYSIFEDNISSFLRATVTERLETNDYAMVYDISIATNKGASEVCDVQVAYGDDERSVIMLELFFKKDNRMEMAYSQVNKSTRAEGILNFDEKLSLIHGNALFHGVFDSNEDVCHSHFDNYFSNGFQPEIREKLLAEIHEKLQESTNFHTNMKVITSKGETFWYSLELHRVTLDTSGTDKIMVYLTNIERQVEMEEQLDDINRYFSVLQKMWGGKLYRFDIKNRILYRTSEYAKSYNLPDVGEHYPDVDYLKNVIHPEDLQAYITFIEEVAGGKEGSIDSRVKMKDGDYEYHSMRFKALKKQDGSVEEMVGFAQNIHAIRETEEKLDMINQYFTALQDLSDDMLYRVDLTTKTLYRTTQQAEIFGIAPIMPNYPQSVMESGIIHPEDEKNYLKYGEGILNGIPSQVEVRMKSSQGDYEYRRLICTPVLGEHGVVTEMFGKIVNIQMVRELEEQANYDALTRVLNKRAMLEFSSDILNNSLSTCKHALFFMDLDNFKGANDNLGHVFGDFLLKELGQRLKDSIRQQDLVGRVGGDEFIIFLRDVPNVEILMGKAKMLLSTISEDFFDGTIRHSIHGSLGVAMFPDHGTTYEELYHHADIALYNSKNKGKNMVTIFDASLDKG